jgi:molybdenum cofactor cytidylyltransferase
MAGRYFAIVPAAGSSSRMRAPKLLLPVDGQPLIARTLAAWERSGADRIVVVVRPGDEALIAAAEKSKVQSPRSKVEVVIPEVSPADMKASVRVALRHIERDYSPNEADAFLVAPADMPRLSTAIVNRLIEWHAERASVKIYVPEIGGRRGHPVLFSWPLANDVFKLSADEGLNALVERHQALLVPCEDLVAAGECPFADVDTPEQYSQLGKECRQTNA